MAETVLAKWLKYNFLVHFQLLRDEFLVLQATYNGLDEKYRTLQLEYNALIERWTNLKKQEADFLNEQNEKAVT